MDRPCQQVQVERFARARNSDNLIRDFIHRGRTLETLIDLNGVVGDLVVILHLSIFLIIRGQLSIRTFILKDKTDVILLRQ